MGSYGLFYLLNRWEKPVFFIKLEVYLWETKGEKKVKLKVPFHDNIQIFLKSSIRFISFKLIQQSWSLFKVHQKSYRICLRNNCLKKTIKTTCTSLLSFHLLKKCRLLANCFLHKQTQLPYFRTPEQLHNKEFSMASQCCLFVFIYFFHWKESVHCKDFWTEKDVKREKKNNMLQIGHLKIKIPRQVNAGLVSLVPFFKEKNICWVLIVQRPPLLCTLKLQSWDLYIFLYFRSAARKKKKSIFLTYTDI